MRLLLVRRKGKGYRIFRDCTVPVNCRKETKMCMPQVVSMTPEIILGIIGMLMENKTERLQ